MRFVESAAEAWGKTALIIMCDQEPATKAILSALCQRRSHQTVPRHSPNYGSRSQGVVESCNNLVQERFRTLKPATEEALCVHPVVERVGSLDTRRGSAALVGNECGVGRQRVRREQGADHLPTVHRAPVQRDEGEDADWIAVGPTAVFGRNGAAGAATSVHHASLDREARHDAGLCAV